MGRSWLRSSVVPGACWGAGRGSPEGFRSELPTIPLNQPILLSSCNRFLSFLSNFRFKGTFRGFIWVYGVKMYI